MNIFTFLQWLWAILIALGLPLLILRPIMLLRGEKKVLTDRTKSILWFLQALGFWALVIGGWMKVEALIPTLLEDEAEEGGETDEGDDDEKNDEDEEGKKDDDE
ncbi:MAG: hypothetical protein D6773_04110 [Alphaproteobacteria bacterium]|nr:MAG: hypothetical protein D6773_04110 [Alphaproteobacteria bacterium]